MIDVILSRDLSETSVPSICFLDGLPFSEIVSPIAFFDYWWVWDDDLEMRPEYLGTKEAGIKLSIPFNVKQVTLPGEAFSPGRNVRIYQIARTKDGRRSDAFIKEAQYYVLHLLAPDVVTYSAGAVTYGGSDYVTY